MKKNALKKEIDCPNQCGDKIQRKDIFKHGNEDCQEAVISCKYCKQLMKRKNHSSHLNENVQTHMSLLFDQYDRRLTDLNKQIQEVKTNYALETKQRIKKVFTDLKEKCKEDNFFF